MLCQNREYETLPNVQSVLRREQCSVGMSVNIISGSLRYANKTQIIRNAMKLVKMPIKRQFVAISLSLSFTAT